MLKAHGKLFREQLTALKYRFEHWLFQWTRDEENAITFTIAGVLNFTKYKEHTIIRMGRRWPSAPKYVEMTQPTI